MTALPQLAFVKAFRRKLYGDAADILRKLADVTVGVPSVVVAAAQLVRTVLKVSHDDDDDDDLEEDKEAAVDGLDVLRRVVARVIKDPNSLYTVRPRNEVPSSETKPHRACQRALSNAALAAHVVNSSRDARCPFFDLGFMVQVSGYLHPAPKILGFPSMRASVG